MFRVKGCFDALDKKYVSILFLLTVIIIINLFVVANDYRWSKLTKYLCCHGYHVVVQIYEDADDPNVSIDIVMVTKCYRLLNRQ